MATAFNVSVSTDESMLAGNVCNEFAEDPDALHYGPAQADALERETAKAKIIAPKHKASLPFPQLLTRFGLSELKMTECDAAKIPGLQVKGPKTLAHADQVHFRDLSALAHGPRKRTAKDARDSRRAERRGHVHLDFVGPFRIPTLTGRGN